MDTGRSMKEKLKHVEHAINHTLPITILHHVDDIVKTCAALCNLKPLLINSK